MITNQNICYEGNEYDEIVEYNQAAPRRQLMLLNCGVGEDS